MAQPTSTAFSDEVETQLGDLTTAHTWFKEHILTLLGVLITLSGDDYQALMERLAHILMCPISKIKQAAGGVELLTHMPSLYEKVTKGSTLNIDMLATIATQASKFEDIDFPELENVLITVLFGDIPCTSPAKLNTQIRTAAYKHCTRKPARKPKKSTSKPEDSTPKEKLYTSAPPQGLSNECYQAADPATDSMVFDPVTSTCQMNFVCTPSHFNLMKRLVEDHANHQGISFSQALMRLVGGGKRPRINLYAIGAPGGRLLVEGKGWINTEELDAQDMLLLKDHRLTPYQLAELLIGDTSLDAFAA